MPRIKLEMPDHFAFSTSIPVRITDLNYGGHVGNDNILSIVHEARVQYLAHFGYHEMNIGGVGLIMSEVVIEFRNELFYGDIIQAAVRATAFSGAGFELSYKLEKILDGKKFVVVLARTAMVCYDYSRKKITHLPGDVKLKLSE